MELHRPAADLAYHPLFIDGEWCDADDGRAFTVHEPATGAAIATVASAGNADIDRAVVAARRAFDAGPWPHMPPSERANILHKITDMLEERSFEIAELEARDGGVPVRKTTYMDIPLGLHMMRSFAELARRHPYEPLPWSDFPAVSWEYVWRDPVGVCAQIIPWNYAFCMAIWKIAPALATGNTIIFKPSALAPLTSIEIVRIINESGLLPKGVLNMVNGPGAEAGELLTSHPGIDKVAFTGSTEVGRKVMAQAAQTIKKVTLELGGKSPSIVLPDADLDMIIDGILFGVFYHSGQLCESGTRCFVHHKMHDALVERLVARTKQLRIGDPLNPETDIGPLISAQQRDRVERYIDIGYAEGARLVVGGGRPKGEEFAHGAYLEPTIFSNVHNRTHLAQEEIFGPVLAVLPYNDVGDAIQMANDSMYGLAGAVWGRDLQQAIEVARRLRTGTVWINDHHMLNPNTPFGGFKQSGLGREMGTYGLDEYTEPKRISVSLMSGRKGRLWWDALLPE